MRVLCGLLLVGLALGWGSSGQGTGTAVIRGRVDVTLPLPKIEPRPAIGDLGASPAPGQVDRRRTVVYLAEAPRAAFEQLEPTRARIDQRNETFVPRVIAITAGTVVDFPNNDLTYHNVFSLSAARPFDLGRYAAGRSKSVRFDRPGIVRVFCDIHSHMSAFILVFAHPFFAVTDEDGDYAIRNVPPGRYTLKVWHETLPEASRAVVVSDTATVVEANFALGPGGR